MKKHALALWDWSKDKGYLVVIGVVAVLAIAYGLATRQGAGVLKKLLEHRKKLADNRRKIRADTDRDATAIETSAESRAREIERSADEEVATLEAKREADREEAHAKVDAETDELRSDADAARAHIDRVLDES